MSSLKISQGNWQKFLWPSLRVETGKEFGLVGFLDRTRFIFIIGLLLTYALGAAILAADNLFRMGNVLVGVETVCVSVGFVLLAYMVNRNRRQMPLVQNLTVGLSAFVFVFAVFNNSTLPLVFLGAFPVLCYLILPVRKALISSILMLLTCIGTLYISPVSANGDILLRVVLEYLFIVPFLHFQLCVANHLVTFHINQVNRRTKFINDINHELRTPLNGLTGLLHIAKTLSSSTDDLARSKLTEYLNKMEDVQEHLVSIVSTSLDLSQARAGKIVTKKDWINAAALMESTKANFGECCRKKGLDFSCTVSDSLKGHEIEADALRLRQILFNFVSNACKYTSSGYVKVELDISTEQENSSQLIFTVKDTGLGIPEQEQYRVFEEFTQFHHGEEFLTTGTGLGLSLVKGLVTALEGECGFVSQYGVGSTFWCRVPVTTRPATCQAIKTDVTDKSIRNGILSAELEGLRVLVVDDAPINRKVIAGILEGKGVEVVQAKGGEEALISIWADRRQFDLLLIDLQMPNMSGYETIKKIREFGAYKDVPALCITGSTDKEVGDCLRQGFDEMLIKPIKPQVLVSAVGYYSKFGRKHRPYDMGMKARI